MLIFSPTGSSANRTEKEKREQEIRRTKRFISNESLVARHVSRLLWERGKTEADGALAFVAQDGLEGNALAVTIMRRVYRRFLNEHYPPPDAEGIIDRYIEFYTDLSRYFRRAGIIE